MSVDLISFCHILCCPPLNLFLGDFILSFFVPHSQFESFFLWDFLISICLLTQLLSELIAGAFLSSLFQVTLERFSSSDFKDLFNKGLVEKLEITLNSINQLLDDAETKQYQNQNVKNWLDHLKHEVYEVDQLLDEIATNAQQKIKAKRFLSTFTNRFESRIKDLLDKLKYLAEQNDVLGLTQRSCTSYEEGLLKCCGRDKSEEELGCIIYRH
ncbi:hypothetical protein P8452_19314 [Trifolium repens]|nr:hypothetical protein P8452_19314 [Trifolium repens]